MKRGRATIMVEPISCLLLALLLDLLLGDPEFRLHPVRIIGITISKTEDMLRRVNFIGHGVKGVLLLFFVTCSFTWGTWILLEWAWAYGPITGTISSSVCLYFTIGMKCLAKEALGVYEELRNKDIPGAQTRLSRIVGRDTEVLDQTGVSRATIETVSENLVDAVLAPIFYWVLLGTPGAIFYRVVNTLDAMVGYRDERYRELGWASARLDDVLNFIPARMAPAAIFVAAWILRKCPGITGLEPGHIRHMPGITRCNGMRCAGLVRTVLIEGKGHESPNSAISEAAFAHCLGISLGGPTQYKHGVKQRSFLNQNAPPPSPDHIVLSVKLMYTTTFVAVAFIWAVIKSKEFF